MENSVKSIFDIYDDVKSHVSKNYSFEQTYREVYESLLAYYSTPEGRAQIDRSPHRHLSTREAVALLMEDVDKRIKWEKKDKSKGEEDYA